MTFVAGTLSRYFALRFFGAVTAVFGGVFALVTMIDYIEMLRQTSDIPNVSALVIAEITLFRAPQITERIMPFCILVGAMSCYLTLSRRLELVIARATGISAWQFVTPALVVALLIGIFATTVYNPLSATLQERAQRLQDDLTGNHPTKGRESGSFWVRQRSADGQAIINANTSREQGVRLGGVTVFTFDSTDHFHERIEAASAVLETGAWRLQDVRVYVANAPPIDRDTYYLSTNLSPEQVRESFATPETVPFWQLPTYIDTAEQAGLVAAGYRLQYQKLLARPFTLASMVFVAAAVSLRFFRFGGVQKMVLGGVAAGFLLYVGSKVIEDMSKAELLHPVAAAWSPALVGGLVGLVALLFQEDG
ncbi:MAG: LPS export ABC transporter permease LptG [Xanthobacteraceae bacterium]